MPPKYLGLRVDVCTFQGMRYGVPNILRLLSSLSLQATFFISLGPDYSGRAIFNIFRKGFFTKMVRTNAVAMYGMKTMLYGTLLPAPIISEKCRSIIKDIQKDGHEIGIHSWNHRHWQDELESFTEDQIRAEYDQSINTFNDILGTKPIGSAAPAWKTSLQSLRIQEEYSFPFASDSRGQSPFYPFIDGQELKTLQIPVTLPTMDEVLGRNDIIIDNYNDYILQQINKQSLPTYVIHSEAEGRRYTTQCIALLERLCSLGIKICRLSIIPTMVKPEPAAINYGTIPGRSGLVTLQS
jgi:peptidoglycan/xylan/chitin deacetylase (PgdA/CDA1 family)